MPFLLNKLQFSNPRWWVFSRVLAALIGGYVLATVASMLISQLFGGSVGQYQAIHIGLMLSFLIYACAAMWVFSVSSAKHAWLGLFKLNIILLALTWAFILVKN